jgi:hypothetical protein
VSNPLIIACFSELEQHFRLIGGQLLVEKESSSSEKLEGELLYFLLHCASSQVPHP